MNTDKRIEHTPIPLTFMDEPDGMSDTIIQYEGCPLISVRGTDDMSCIDAEDEPAIRQECIDRAHFVLKACNHFYEMRKVLERCKSMMQRDKVGGYTRTHSGNDFAEPGSAYELVESILKKTE